MKVRGHKLAKLPKFFEVQLQKQLFVHNNFEPRVSQSGEEFLYPSELNLTDQVVLDLLSQNAN